MNENIDPLERLSLHKQLSEFSETQKAMLSRLAVLEAQVLLTLEKTEALAEYILEEFEDEPGDILAN